MTPEIHLFPIFILIAVLCSHLFSMRGLVGGFSGDRREFSNQTWQSGVGEHRASDKPGPVPHVHPPERDEMILGHKDTSLSPTEKTLKTIEKSNIVCYLRPKLKNLFPVGETESLEGNEE